MSTKVSALTQATNAELSTAALAYIVADPSGTPVSRKSALARLGLPPQYVADAVKDILTPAVGANDASTGQYFVSERSGQTCTGVRVWWAGTTVRTLKLSLWQDGISAAALASGTVTTSGAAGYYSVTFGSAVSLSRSAAYIATCWENSGNEVMSSSAMGPIGSYYHLNPSYGGLQLMSYRIITWGYYSSGDALPGSQVAGSYYVVDPLISG
jgi:hypothetical protein